MLYYIIDGYNLINSLPFLKNKSSLEEKRHNLVDLISRYRLTGSSNNKTMIVFDGKEECENKQKVFGFEIIFTEGSADEFIIRTVENHKNPKIVVVVSDDRQICVKAKRLGAKILSTKDFFTPLFRKKEEKVLDKFMLKPKQIEMINQELKKIWLGDF